MATSRRDDARRASVLHYLGHQGQEIGPDLEHRLDEAMARCDELARPAVVRRTFAREDVRFAGKDLEEHLSDAREVVLFAATLGHDIDRELRRLSLVDALGQVIFDAAATAAVERLADKTEAEVRAEAFERGLYCSWRFSPGYGDLPLDEQPRLLAMVDATRRVGITLTPSNLMVPTKSVTAIIGIHPTPQPGLASSCAICSLAEHCTLRARGLRCR